MRSIPLVLFTRKAAFLVLTVVMLALASPLLAASVTLPDGSTYNIEQTGPGGDHWVYEVSEVSGKSLSHWGLHIPLCAGDIDRTFPPATAIGIDGSTGYWLIKWDLSDSFTSGQFHIWLDSTYLEGSVDALFKAGPSYATGTVAGPLCGITPPQDPEPPTATATATEVGGTIPPPTATATDEPTATATQTGGTIPPTTQTSEPTATQPGGTIPPPTATATGTPTQTGGTIPPPTATATQASEPLPTCWLVIGDRIGSICTPTPDGPTVTPSPTATATIQPDDQTPTPTATTQPTNEEEGPEPKSHRLWAPIVGNCMFGDADFGGCGRVAASAQDTTSQTRRAWLPLVNGYGPRIVLPAVVEANTTSSVSMDPQAPDACFDELQQVSAADVQVAICPIPGRRYPVLAGAQNIALVGYGDSARRLAWGGASTYTVHNPTEIIADADAIEFGNSLTSDDTTAGPVVTSGPYVLMILPSEQASAAEVNQSFEDLLDFGASLRKLIQETESELVHLNRSGVWYDSTGLTPTTPVALGCGSGSQIEWVATGPVKWVGTGSGVRVIFKGEFNNPVDNSCMDPFKWVEVARLMAIPALKEKVDRYRGSAAAARWNWDIGDGLARTFSWTGWDYLSFFAVRSSGSGVPAMNSYFLIIPTDFLDLSCSFLNGRKVCAVEQKQELSALMP